MIGILLPAALLLIAVANGNAQTPSYQGKTVKIIVGYLAGDSHDLWARAYARVMSKHLPGKPEFLVQNMPGAGSMIAANYIYNVAKPDGTTLGSIAPGLYLAQLIGNKEVKFDWPKFTWVGSPEQNGNLLFMRADSPYKTLEDIRNAKEPPKCSATGVGTSGHLIPTLLEETLGLKFQIVTGYPGGAEQDLALERGEVHCRAITTAAFFSRQPFINWHKTGVVRILIQTSRKRNPIISQVPTLFELMDKQKVSDSNRRLANVALGSGGFGAWPIVSTPGLSPEHTRLLRAAYANTLQDPDFLEEAKKRGWDLKPTAGEELATLAKEVTEQPAEVVARLKKLLGNK
jgi:tripartite-type tricarboxylate transporter receptor subunit TctC